MSAEADLSAKRQGLRIAAAVALGLTAGVSTGAVLPFLAPMFAAQFLTARRRPLGLGQAIGFVVLILLVGQSLIILTGVFGDRPVAFIALLGLIHFLCFYM